MSIFLNCNSPIFLHYTFHPSRFGKMRFLHEETKHNWTVDGVNSIYHWLWLVWRSSIGRLNCSRDNCNFRPDVCQHCWELRGSFEAIPSRQWTRALDGRQPPNGSQEANLQPLQYTSAERSFPGRQIRWASRVARGSVSLKMITIDPKCAVHFNWNSTA